MSLKSELEKLLGQICVEWGFCLQGNEYEEITESNKIDATSFALAVLRAEGFEPPENEIEWLRRLKNRFINHFGCSEANSFQYGGRITP